jgi:septal ring factor EnvC (AmiA/AmiB activator)
LDRRLSKTKIELEKESQRSDSIQVDLKRRRELLARRIRGIYKFSRFDQYQVIFGSSSLTDLLRRLKYLQLIAKEDNALIDGFLNEKDKLEESRRKLEAKGKEVRALKMEKEGEEGNKTKEVERKKKVLHKIKSEKKLYLGAEKELERNAKKIQDFLDDYEKERQKDESERDLFEILKGRLDWPVKGKVISSFGEKKHPVFKTVTFNQGIDIEASPGTEVKAVADGKVIYSSYLRGRGKFLILQHEYGYYSIYADLGEILVGEGQGVEKGQPIAKVGEGGLLLPYSLHFELRKGKKQLDPLEWLK